MQKRPKISKKNIDVKKTKKNTLMLEERMSSAANYEEFRRCSRDDQIMLGERSRGWVELKKKKKEGKLK